MTPHRSHTLVGYVAAFKAAIAAPTDVSTGVGAGLLAIFLAFWNLHVVLLFILVVGAGGVDLLVGARRAHYSERAGKGRFSDQVLSDGMWGKALILIVILFLGICADSMIILAGGVTQLGFVSLFQTLTPVTAAMLLYRLTKETASIKRNIKETPGGKDAIWEGFDFFLDELRYRALHPGAEWVPRRRRGDQLRQAPPTAAELAVLYEEAKERERAAATAPPPHP